MSKLVRACVCVIVCERERDQTDKVSGEIMSRSYIVCFKFLLNVWYYCLMFSPWIISSKKTPHFFIKTSLKR